MVLETRPVFNIDEIVSNLKITLSGNTSDDNVKSVLKNFLAMINLYVSAAKEISTRLEIIDIEFQVLYSHNPIHYITSRIKSPQSIQKKLEKLGSVFDTKSVMENITDIAGIRVICHYIEEVYLIADLLSKQDDIKVLRCSDYIKEPKPSGYRSLHLVVSVPVFLSEGKRMVPVEVQIRTIAMDFWASLEHQLGYKTKGAVTDTLHTQLKECAENISAIDLQMQNIYRKINEIE